MKGGKIIAITILLISIGVVIFAQEVKRSAKILFINGEVSVKFKGSQEWSPVEKGTVVNEGDIIKTGEDSRVILNLDGAGETASVEISPKSQLALSELTLDKKDGTQSTLLDLAIGKVLIKAQKLHTEKSKFEVKTPTSIVGVRGTVFAVEVESLD